jgi:septum formation protein
MATRRLVLASGSRYRARVLREAGYEIEVDPPSVDERALDALFAEDPHRLALELAQRKAADVAPRHPDATVLAGDQVGLLVTPEGPRQLTKQPDEERAVEQLVAMSGTTHRLVNGVVLLRTDASAAVQRSLGGLDVQEVTMRAFSREEAVAYVRRFEPFDSAGSYRLEDQDEMAPDQRFVVDVRGEDPSGVLGLPLPLLARLLEALDG